MIVLQRSANVAGGRIAEALPWAHKIAGIWKEITGVSVDVMVPVGGNPFQLVWRGNYDSLADLEEANGKALSNDEYMAEITSASEMFIDGSVEDRIWQTM